MSVDKFGRHQDFTFRQRIRGPPVEGFNLTPYGNYDMNNLLVRNVAEPKAGKDAVTLQYVKSNCLTSLSNGDYGCDGRLIRNVGAPIHSNDVATKGYIQNISLIRKQDVNEFTANNLKITDIADGSNECDAVNLRLLKNELAKLNLSVQGQMVKMAGSLFHYIHRQSGVSPSPNVDNNNYLDWKRIHGNAQ